MTSAAPSDACQFCAIARGEDTSVETICEAQDWIAFFPPEPATVGHTLVIPRVHVSDFLGLDRDVGCALMEGVGRVGRAIKDALQPDGMNLISSSGEAASQTVFHVHFHLVPRRREDRFGDIWPPKRAMDEEVKEDVADLVREACARTS